MAKGHKANQSSLDLRVLRYFIAVAEEGNITWAAELLQVSQPTLSRQLRAMEESLGVTLFHRGSHEIALTGEGRLLLERARTMVALADKTEQDLREVGNNLTGTLTLGCGESRSLPRLFARMAAFRQEHPAVRFDIQTLTADVSKDRLDQGLLDLAVLVEPVSVDRYEYLRLPEHDMWGAQLRADDPLVMSGATAIHPVDCVDRDVIMPMRPEVRDEMLAWLGDYAHRINVAGTFNLALNGTNMVRAGLGIRLGFDVAERPDDIRFLPLDPPIHTQTLLAWRKGRSLAPVAQAFVDFLRTSSEGGGQSSR